jgi:uncharacterized damage-inducible protein DinB
MTIAEILLQDYDVEAKNTRTTLERIPTHLAEFKSHEKSMPMPMLTVEKMDLSKQKFPQLIFESTEATVRAFDETSSELRDTLLQQPDAELERNWTMVFGDKTIADGPRLQLFRTMFLNHQIHHRAQLGVYLRLNNLPVPALYGPSADDRMGF